MKKSAKLFWSILEAIRYLIIFSIMGKVIQFIFNRTIAPSYPIFETDISGPGLSVIFVSVILALIPLTGKHKYFGFIVGVVGSIIFTPVLIYGFFLIGWIKSISFFPSVPINYVGGWIGFLIDLCFAGFAAQKVYLFCLRHEHVGLGLSEPETVLHNV